MSTLQFPEGGHFIILVTCTTFECKAIDDPISILSPARPVPCSAAVIKSPLSPLRATNVFAVAQSNRDALGTCAGEVGS